MCATLTEHGECRQITDCAWLDKSSTCADRLGCTRCALAAAAVNAYAVLYDCVLDTLDAPLLGWMAAASELVTCMRSVSRGVSQV